MWLSTGLDFEWQIRECYLEKQLFHNKKLTGVTVFQREISFDEA